jgi:hypothetical protein
MWRLSWTRCLTRNGSRCLIIDTGCVFRVGPVTVDVMNMPGDDEPDEALALLEAELGDSLDMLCEVVLMDVAEIARAAGRLIEPDTEPE